MQQVVAAKLFLRAMEFFDKLPVVPQERGSGGKSAFDESLANEQFACGVRIDWPERDVAARHDNEPGERDPFIRHGRAALGVPMGFAIGAPDQVFGERFDPGRIDLGATSQVAFGGFDQFGPYHPFRFRLKQPGTGP